jgi:hypothetical protein
LSHFDLLIPMPVFVAPGTPMPTARMQLIKTQSWLYLLQLSFYNLRSAPGSLGVACLLQFLSLEGHELRCLPLSPRRRTLVHVVNVAKPILLIKPRPNHFLIYLNS